MVFPEFWTFLVWGNIWLLVRLQTLFDFSRVRACQSIFLCNLGKETLYSFTNKVVPGCCYHSCCRQDQDVMLEKTNKQFIRVDQNWIKLSLHKKWDSDNCVTEVVTHWQYLGKGFGKESCPHKLGVGNCGLTVLCGVICVSWHMLSFKECLNLKEFLKFTFKHIKNRLSFLAW